MISSIPNEKMDNPALHTYVMAPLVKGVLAGTFASFYIGNVGKVPLMGMPVSPAVLIGSSVAGASLVSTLSHDFVLAKIKGNKYYDLEGKALSMVLTGGATMAVGAATLGVLDLKAYGELFALGAGAEIAGSYAHDMIMAAVMSGHANALAMHH